MTDISEIILEFIRDEIVKNPEQIPDLQENLLASGVIDSVGIMMLVRHLEATLGLSIPDGDLVPKNFRTIEVMATYLEDLRSASGG
ncbi:MAG: acyl carrier protein [Verrucomicrobiales bacterium]